MKNRLRFDMMHSRAGNGISHSHGAADSGRISGPMSRVTYDGSSRAQGTKLYVNGAAAGRRGRPRQPDPHDHSQRRWRTRATTSLASSSASGCAHQDDEGRRHRRDARLTEGADAAEVRFLHEPDVKPPRRSRSPRQELVDLLVASDPKVDRGAHRTHRGARRRERDRLARAADHGDGRYAEAAAHLRAGARELRGPRRRGAAARPGRGPARGIPRWPENRIGLAHGCSIRRTR